MLIEKNIDYKDQLIAEGLLVAANQLSVEARMTLLRGLAASFSKQEILDQLQHLTAAIDSATITNSINFPEITPINQQFEQSLSADDSAAGVGTNDQISPLRAMGIYARCETDAAPAPRPRSQSL